MDARSGLLDNLCNPRRAFTVLRCLNAALQPFRGTSFEPQLQEAPGLRTLELQSGSTALALMLPEGEQRLPPALLERAAKASAARLYHLAQGPGEEFGIEPPEAASVSGGGACFRAAERGGVSLSKALTGDSDKNDSGKLAAPERLRAQADSFPPAQCFR